MEPIRMIASVGQRPRLCLSLNGPNAHSMRCEFCFGVGSTFRRRAFPRLDRTYLVCGNCGRAQRRQKVLKTAARGVRAAERESLRKALAIAKARQKFKILVWGPASASGNRAATKRAQIRDELLKMGHDAFFSEDMVVPGVPTNILEMLQQRIVHLVIDVAASPGSMAEFENYGVILGKRHLVFLNDAARGGFTDTGTRRLFRAAGGDDEFFSEADLMSCALTLASADWVGDKAYYEMYLAELKKAADEASLLR